MIMRKWLAIAAIPVIASCQNQMRILENSGVIRVEPANREGSDYVVHLRNMVDFGFNPDDKANRQKWAVDMLRSQCANPQIVEEIVIETGSYGIGGKSRQYSIFMKCG
jgi:hypothetical protein